MAVEIPKTIADVVLKAMAPEVSARYARAHAALALQNLPSLVSAMATIFCESPSLMRVPTIALPPRGDRRAVIPSGSSSTGRQIPTNPGSTRAEETRTGMGAGKSIGLAAAAPVGGPGPGIHADHLARRDRRETFDA